MTIKTSSDISPRRRRRRWLTQKESVGGLKKRRERNISRFVAAGETEPAERPTQSA
jgi:hypothetical protein